VRTRSQAFVEDSIGVGRSVQILVSPSLEQGLPPQLVELGMPVMLNLYGDRPIHFISDGNVFRVDLCFAGPPYTCSFQWDDLVAVKAFGADAWEWTMVLKPFIVMEDGSMVGLKSTDETVVDEPPVPRPHLSIVK